MNPNNIILDIKRNLMNSRNPRELCCIYIAVGCAAHMVKDGKLEDLYYHQYPKCLEILKNETNINIIHILIDPTLESPPFMTIDRSKGVDFIQSSPISYTSNDGKHMVYSVKEAINIECYGKREDTVDITQFLIELNILFGFKTAGYNLINSSITNVPSSIIYVFKLSYIYFVKTT